MPEEASAPVPAGLLLSDDLMFASRITGTARSLGHHLQVVRTPQQVQDLAASQKPTCVLLDLAVAGADGPALIGRLKNTLGYVPFLVAYGSHVDVATLQAARQAGCDVVLPRSKFVEELRQSLANWLTGS
jgi:CheY-like chemotaxis protein